MRLCKFVYRALRRGIRSFCAGDMILALSVAEFEQMFASDVWSLLSSVTAETKHDQVFPA